MNASIHDPIAHHAEHDQKVEAEVEHVVVEEVIDPPKTPITF